MKLTDSNGNIKFNAGAIDTVPIGTTVAYGGGDIPTGYLNCNGAAVSRTTYADLFNKIGTSFGAGDGSTTFNLPNEPFIPSPLGYIGGMVTSYASGTAAGTSGSVNVGRGMCSDNSGLAMMFISSGLTKTIASGTTWQSGTNKAGLDAVYPVASLQSGWLHAYAISDGSVTDMIMCNSVSGLMPVSFPSGMIYSRRIGSIRTDASGNVISFHQYGDNFLPDQPFVDVNTNALVSGTTIYTLTTPPGIKTQALLNVAYTNQVGAATVYFTPITSDASVGVGAAVGAITYRNPAIGNFAAGPAAIFTDTSGRIRVQNNFQSGQLFVGTGGWIDARGKDLA
jgi:hypothetical protein